MSVSSLADRLLVWHSSIERNMPWKATRDPYKIWLSEVILQQTRVAQGLPYYLRFVEQYPTVQDLAKAPLDAVLKLWQGLGYYSRARNLHTAANQIVREYNGVFPTEYVDVLGLKGVGKYTAAAIMSFAYDKRYPVVDGNVLRVISRLYGVHEPIDTPSVVRQIYAISDRLIANVAPDQYNQAIMDLGAIVCTPKQAQCDDCPFISECIAKRDNTIDQIPYKSKKIKKRNRYFHYLDIRSKDGFTLLKQRGAKDIWQGLFDFPLIEKPRGGKLTKKQLSEGLEVLGVDEFSLSSSSHQFKHMLSHQTIYATFHRIIVDGLSDIESYKKITHSEMDHYALPVLMTNYLNTLR